MLSLLLSLFAVCSCNDTPFVINRITDQIDFSDLLQGYNYGHADNHSEEVTISFSIRRLFALPYKLFITCEIFQKWQDLRLKYSGINSITIPKDIKIWKPDTCFFDSSIIFAEESFRLYSDGTIYWKQRATLTVPCISDFVLEENDLSLPNCSLIIGSFDNSGAESIIYKVGDILLPTNFNSLNHSINYTIRTFKEVALNGETIIQTAINFFIEPNIQSSNKTELW